MSDARVLNSPGPVSDAFRQSRAFIKICVGPVGSGKTLTALVSGLELAARQGGRVDAKGVLRRKGRIGVIRESYPSLEATTLKSWFNIVPRDKGFSMRAPYTHRFAKALKFDPETGALLERLDCEFEFRAIGDQGVEAACRGWEVNAVIVDEADIQPSDLIPYLTGRVGRFSDLDPKTVVDPQIIVVMNMPDVDNHAYRLAFDREMEGLDPDANRILQDWLGDRPLIETFVQPGGMDPAAENLHNLEGGRAYYVRQIAANKHKPGYIDRMVHNKPVALMHGLPVNPDFDHRLHVVDGLKWDRRFKLVVGVDQGQFPAMVPLFRNELGQIRTLGILANMAPNGKELLKVGAATFGKMCRNYLLEKFTGIRPDDLRVVGDPAMFAASDKPTDEYDWRLSFQSALGFMVHRAKTNKAALRNETIWKAMKEVRGYQIDASARLLIKAHAGGYRYSKTENVHGETKGNLVIADTIYHNFADAEQYAAMEGEFTISDVRGRPRAPQQFQFKTDYDVFSNLN